MFTTLPKLPQRFTSLLGDEAKLAFRSQASGISKLAQVRNISEIDSYWDQYTILFDSASDVFSLIAPHDIRRALLDAPENVATLIRVICARLSNLISAHTFPESVQSTSASMTSYATSFLKNSPDRNTTKEVLNCLRILQRVLPVVFEVDGESNVFEDEVMWKKQEVEQNPIQDQTDQFVIEDDDDEEPADAAAPPPPQATPKKTLPSLAEKLFTSLTDLLFCCGFTLPTKLQVDHHKIQYVIWEKGIGSAADHGPAHAYDANKTEVLRLLLILLSRQVYVPPSALLTNPSLYTLHLAQKMSRRDVLTVLCSLLNTAMNSPSASNTTMIAEMAGKLPYNHLVFKGEDSRSNLVGMCLQVLCVLLDFQSGAARDNLQGTGDNQTSTPSARTNAFRYFLAKLHRTQDFEFITSGTCGILEQQMATMNNLLPGARRSVPYAVENVIFFWKMIELNKKFRAYVLESERSMDIVAHLLCFTLEVKDKPQQHGLCRALSYILQTLSAEPAFGVKMSTPIKAQIPAKWHSGGTSADFLVNAIYAIVATTSGTLNSLYPALIITLSNSAPYFKHLTVATSSRLLQLFTSFSNPAFLLADEGHPRLLFFMLEVFNGIILHNLQQNPNLVYSLLTTHKVFEDLGTFTLSRGLRELKRIQLAKEEQAQRGEGKTQSKVPSPKQDTVEAPHEEKARLLQSESTQSLERGRGPRDSVESIPQITHQEEESELQPLVSPTTSQRPSAISEKAQGKMRARRSGSGDDMSGLEGVAAAAVGRNGFVPTQEWVTSWQQGLPLDSVLLVISELAPKVQELQASLHRPNPTSTIVDFLGNVSLQHVLPRPPPLAPRKFVWSDASIVWLTSLIWGEIYVRGMTPLAVWNATNVRLFYVKHAQTQQRQITETMSNMSNALVGGLGGLGLRRNTETSQSLLPR